jgi:hypothetical protein
MGIIGMAGGVALPRAQDPAPAGISRLAILTGCWKGTVSGAKPCEGQWLPPGAGTMAALSRTVRMNDSVSFGLAPEGATP